MLWLARRSSCVSPAVGVVMGQGQGGDTSVILAAAGKAATQLVESAQN